MGSSRFPRWNSQLSEVFKEFDRVRGLREGLMGIMGLSSEGVRKLVLWDFHGKGKYGGGLEADKLKENCMRTGLLTIRMYASIYYCTVHRCMNGRDVWYG